MISGEAAKPRGVRSLQNWVNGNGCLSWEETKYLTHCHDLRNAIPSQDDATVQFETWVEDCLVHLVKKFQNVSVIISTVALSFSNLTVQIPERSHPNLSRDPRIFIFSPHFISRIARAFIVLLIIILLSAPIIICHSLDKSFTRIIVIIVSLAVFVVTMSCVVTRRTNELFFAGAT